MIGGSSSLFCVLFLWQFRFGVLLVMKFCMLNNSRTVQMTMFT